MCAAIQSLGGCLVWFRWSTLVMRIFTSKVVLVIFLEFSIVALKPNHFQLVSALSQGNFVIYTFSIYLIVCHLTYDSTLVQLRPPQQIMVNITMQSTTAVCSGCTIVQSKAPRHRLPHHDHVLRVSLQWFGPHPEVPCWGKPKVPLMQGFGHFPFLQS